MTKRLPMPGKDPHRPEGKTADAEHTGHLYANKGQPYRGPLRPVDEGQANPTSTPAEEQIGGSRPGVESRVKAAIEAREDREAGD